ncbi:Nuclear-pore anchor [Acorus gramineus]|uniref:Nuclear-pore anchor n=1 Tax=Acorus gramineus TaxID=55184 RepID=A0AAV8ZY92_ACOGR|nr:Nuclear-pore anchor [Acorus gramineus]
MPLFITEEELRLLDPPAVAERADGFIRDLQVQLETARAQAEAASITSEQTSSLLEQRYLSLSSDYSRLESLKSDLSASLDQRLADLANLQAENHQLRLQTIEKDGEIERLSVEVSELHKSKRQLLELVELKDAEIGDKNGLIKDYVDKIVDLSENRAQKEARLHDIETELERCRAACARLSQSLCSSKETAAVNEERFSAELSTEVEAKRELKCLGEDGNTGHWEVVTRCNLREEEDEYFSSSESSSTFWHPGGRSRLGEIVASSFRWYSVKWGYDWWRRNRPYDASLAAKSREILGIKILVGQVDPMDFGVCGSQVSKLVELYKESADEWSRKAGEQEGVIKALETYLSQVENDYKEQLEKEASTKRDNEKEVAELKLKFEKCEMELEKARRANEWGLSPITSSEMGSLTEGMDINDERNHKLVPKMLMNISGTALAASLTRDGWSLTKMYEKYQEAADALRHEQLGRKHSEALLKRVLSEIEERSEFILEERAEHDRMVEAYDLMNHKLQQSRSELASHENTIQELKAELKRHEREYNVAQKEIVDLETQVTVLLKECRDVQLRCSGMGEVLDGDIIPGDVVQHSTESDADKVISEHLLTFRDIKGLVEQNVHLRSLVRDLSRHNELQDAELKVAMYKRLYEEAHKPRSDFSQSAEPILDAHAEDRRAGLMLLIEGSQEATRKAHQQLVERAKNLEDDLVKSRSEVMSLRLERDKLAMESKFVRERLDSFIREYEHQRDEANGIRARNVEFTQLIIDYQRRLRESSDLLQASEENARKLSMEVSILKHEREIMVNSEKRASEEVQSLSDRVRRLQASLDTIQSSQEARDDARAMERRMQDDYIRRTERDWAEAKAELQEERDRVRMLTLEKDKKIEHAMDQMDESRKELADALHRIAASEARAAAAEARYSELKAKAESSGTKDVGLDASHTSISSMTEKLKEEMEKLKEEAQINKDYMQQYKQIAQVNEIALKQIEAAHEEYKSESEKKKKTLEAEILSLSEKVSELESDVILKSTIDVVLHELSCYRSQIVAMEFQINLLKEDLEKEHLRWRSAQDNYERQVILQSETIQELTKTSEALAGVQAELVDLRRLANSQKAEKAKQLDRKGESVKLPAPFSFIVICYPNNNEEISTDLPDGNSDFSDPMAS